MSELNGAKPDTSLSALADGQADEAELKRLSAAWRDDHELRGRWHTYHLIGDVLRSDELAQRPAHDAAFLQQLRASLAEEPVVLAPSRAQPAPAQPARRRAWAAPVAVAAGFMAVAGVLLVTQMAPPAGEPGGMPALAALEATALAPAAASASLVATGSPRADEPFLVADQQLIRDARLDRYLSAHKQYGGTAAMAVPGMMLRHAAVVTPDRTER